jgi:hypothetical protein
LWWGREVKTNHTALGLVGTTPDSISGLFGI